MGMVIILKNDLATKIKLVRSSDRVTAQRLIKSMFNDVIELHGDHINGDDHALFSGIGRLGKIPVTLFAVDRGQTVTERQDKNGGAVRASGYRKAIHGLKLAERFNRPVISFLNMPGADASVDSENEGQSKMIADMIAAMGAATVPNLVIIVGEGHSGGALAFANANRIIMLENALFSVAAPEAMAAILRNNDLKEVVPMTASKLLDIKLVDQVINEDQNLVKNLRVAIVEWLDDFSSVSEAKLVDQRYQKFIDVLNFWNEM
ncbi:acetyl-coA carboxylase, carboxyl transferase alpha subunit [Pediococcus claussenii ATCC BAA-344]|uniref:acetyl-CoA carboxytransferase n=1 Tax=Pediococcus claussenii (strain ATCC BAA-344 / DSM 14800 / JCM 18046 / KCTC 3811 / LMG 21948 / P06) TaxID=701521 RepID=G8PB48_PEDCP|nr:acetyl-coA carboxylase, carboxyl transferase alpha subunit [Pediococcus claussenii ATCC BAA-344]ANZ69872.1 carboxyltransferase [Pediococcus claussenii]ANZ71689.1 carboxyltransferase [Pediococcus claussenii]KRN20856.1 accA protein [Pediococcus claussenii]